MFFYCSSLNSIDLSNFNTTNVKNMAAMFDSCSSLKSIDLSNFNTTNVINFQYLFWSAYSMQYIDISSFTTNLISISLFAAQLEKGLIKVRKEFYDIIDRKLNNWIVKYVN